MFRLLSMLVVAVFCVCATATLPAAAAGKSVINAVNKIRAAHGLSRLRLDPRLQRAARDQSSLMARSGRMSHKVGFGHDFGSRLKRVGYRGRLAAENIARGQASLNRVLRGWMTSPGHRRNMLNPRMRYFGLSASKGRGHKYWTMVLGG